MQDRRRAGRIGALVAAFMAGVVATASLPSVAFAQNATTKTTKAPPAPKKKSDEAKRAEARKSFEDGEKKFAGGDFAGAYAAYKAANDVLSSPQTLFKMAAALDKDGKSDEAISAYKTFLAGDPPAAMFESKISESKARLADLQRSIPVVMNVKTDPPGATVSVDGQAQKGTTPLEVKLTPGQHAFHITLDGYDAQDREVAVSPEPGAVEITLSKTAPTPAPVAAPTPTPTPSPAEPAPAPPPERRSNVTAYVLLGATVACVGVGSVFGVKALQAKSDFDNGLKTTDQADTVDRNALIADLLFGTALTLGVTGTVLLLSDPGRAQATQARYVDGKRTSRPTLQVLPVVGPHGAAATARIEF